jgi:hypothetical protein
MKDQTRANRKSVTVGISMVSDDKCDYDNYIKLMNCKGLSSQAVHPRKDINRNSVRVVTLSQSWEAAHA